MKSPNKIRKTWNWLTSGVRFRLIVLWILFCSLTKKFANEEWWFAGLETSSSWLVSISLWFAVTCVLALTAMALIDNREESLITRHRNIERQDRSFFEMDPFTFYLNCLLKVLAYFMLIACFSNLSRAVMVTVLITENYRREKKEAGKQKTYHRFLSWSDANLVNIGLWSLFVCCVITAWKHLFNSQHFSYFRNLWDSMLNRDYTTVKDLYSGVPFAGTAKTMLGLAEKAPLLAIFSYYSRSIINKSRGELQGFWATINAVERKNELFKFFFSVRKTAETGANAVQSTQSTIIACQANYDASPNFIKEQYLKHGELHNYNFASELAAVIAFTEDVEAKVSMAKERNYLLSVMFNDYKSMQQLTEKRGNLVSS